MTTDCSMNYKFKLGENMLRTEIVSYIQDNFCTQHVLLRFELRIFMYWTCNSMNNLSSYCGLVDAKIRASDKDFPVIGDSAACWQKTTLHCNHWNSKTYTRYLWTTLDQIGYLFNFLFKGHHFVRITEMHIWNVPKLRSVALIIAVSWMENWTCF